jgi:hypothetical protein
MVYHLDSLVNQPTEPGVPLARPPVSTPYGLISRTAPPARLNPVRPRAAQSRAYQQPNREPPPARTPALTEPTPARAIARGMSEHYRSRK